jgi:hypothetical protein
VQGLFHEVNTHVFWPVGKVQQQAYAGDLIVARAAKASMGDKSPPTAEAAEGRANGGSLIVSRD